MDPSTDPHLPINNYACIDTNNIKIDEIYKVIVAWNINFQIFTIQIKITKLKLSNY